MQPGQAHNVEMATASGEALLAVRNEVLDFASIGAHLLHLDHAATDSNAIARSVAALFSAAAERQAIDLQVLADAALWDMRLGAALPLRQVLRNRVGNAMKFTPHSLVVSSTRRVGASGGQPVATELKDAGIGSDAAQLQSAPEAAETPLDAVGDAASLECLSGRVLGVEDKPVKPMAGSARLESLGLAVVTADNGEAGLAKLADIAFALVLMDCHMPVLDGGDAARRLRETERRDGLPRRPVIARTANASKSDVARCLAAGRDAHLAKPESAKQLRAAITPWLQGGACTTAQPQRA